MQDREAIIEKAKSWLSNSFDENTRNQVQKLLQENYAELEDSFYKELEFGTGGMRGLMGVGSNRMNKYTIAMATQGLSNYLKNVYRNEKIRVAIAFDSRINSKSFATRTAEIFSANGIEVYLFEDLRPTPQLSFVIRELNCHSGVVITASHNPKEFNGYKVYWNDGGQLVPPHDDNIIKEVRKVTSMNDVKQVVIRDQVKMLGHEIDLQYKAAVINQCINDSMIAQSDLKIVYTPIHGTGITMVPEVLKEAGFKNLKIVEEQSHPDGNFPSVKSPNPEDEGAMSLGMQIAKDNSADILLGTDPDADRVGIAVNHNGIMKLLNGNQAAVLIIHYLITQLKELNKLESNHFVAKTIVTTQLVDSICESHRINCYSTLTGFKYIAEQIRLREGKEIFLAGGEESYGYLIGDYTRDKDAVVSSLILCEIAAWAKTKDLTLVDLLMEIYHKYGFYKESLVSLTKKGRRGAEEIAEIMNSLRKDAKSEILGKKLLKTKDYLERIEKSAISGNISQINLPKSNVFQMFYEDGYCITARPSGTEPKIKFYIAVKGELNQGDDFEQMDEKMEMTLFNIKKELGIA